MTQINKAQYGTILQLIKSASKAKLADKAKLASNWLKRVFTGEAAAEKQLNRLAKQRILQQKSSWRPTQKMREANLEGKKQSIRDAKAMRSAASKAELKWMQENPDKATKVYKSGTREFGGDENKLALLKARQEAIKPFIQNKAKQILRNRLIIGGIGGIGGIGSIPLIFRNQKPYQVSINKNEEAISDHKVNSGVNQPYWIYDKKTGQLKHKQGAKTLASFQTMGGLTTNYDGYNFYDSYKKGVSSGNFYDLSNQAMVTPTGIFTLASSSYEGRPAFRLQEGKRGNNHKRQKLPAMMHIMPNSRIKDFNKGVYNKSYGCINLPEEVLNYMNKNHAVSDSLYVLPVQDGNYIYESSEEGHPLKVHYGNKPTNMTEKHYGIEANLPLKYNEGY